MRLSTAARLHFKAEAEGVASARDRVRGGDYGLEAGLPSGSLVFIKLEM